MATLMLSQGVPMLQAGDEFLRTQLGNNNAWCQDNEVSWLNWDLAAQSADFLRFVREMIAFRKRHYSLRRRTFFHGRGPVGNVRPDITWHGTDPRNPDFSSQSRSLAFTTDGRMTGGEPDSDFYVAFNSWTEVLPFRIPISPSRRSWRRVIDTALASPLDVVGQDQGPEVPALTSYPVAPFSLVVLITPK